ncbi:MAG: VanZ family protein [Clostridia bacterium]|nr:VanZ family protein [Clostridia bacterium]
MLEYKGFFKDWWRMNIFADKNKKTKDSTLHPGMKFIVNASFYVYLVILLYQLFLGRYRTYGAERRYNIRPFNTISRFIEHYDQVTFHSWVINLIGNVVVFMPFGFFLPILFRKINGLGKAFLISMLFSLCAEMIQFIFNVGWFDVDDILLNTAGAVLGFVLYKGLVGVKNRLIGEI